MKKASIKDELRIMSFIDFTGIFTGSSGPLLETAHLQKLS